MQAGDRVLDADRVHWLEQQHRDRVVIAASIGDQVAVRRDISDPARLVAAEQRVIQEGCPARHLGFTGHLLDNFPGLGRAAVQVAGLTLPA